MNNKPDKFDHLIALAAAKCIEEDVKAFKEIDTSEVHFDASYYCKRKRIIKKYKHKRAFKSTKTVAIRLLVAIMIMITLTCALIGCVPKWRRAIYEAIVEWYNDCFVVRYEETDAPPAETRYPETTATETEETNLDEPEESKPVPTYIAEKRKPTNLPEGAWEDVVLQNNSIISIDYYLNDAYLFSFTQRVLKPTDNLVDSEDVNVVYTKINGNDAAAVEYINKEERYILWSDGEYAYYMVSTECDMETLVQYAESVK